MGVSGSRTHGEPVLGLLRNIMKAMDCFADFTDGQKKSFDDRCSTAGERYQEKVAAIHQRDSFGIDVTPFWERERRRLEVTKKAALEYLGHLLFFLLKEYYSLGLSDDELRARVNVTLAGLRKIALDSKWPNTAPLSPDYEEQREQEFDNVLIRWLEEQKNWRKYESRVVPQIAIAAILDGPAQSSSNPLWYFKCWQLGPLSGKARKRIEAGLLEIHGKYLDDNLQSRDCWRSAYDLIAREFESPPKLSKELLNERIPEIVADAAAGGGWCREPLGRAQPSGIFADRFGSQFYPRWRRFDFIEALKGRMTHWGARVITKDRTTPRHEPYNRAPTKLKLHRRQLLDDFRLKKELPDRGALARHLRVDPSALQGMVRGDNRRYGKDKLRAVLTEIECNRQEWDGAKKHGQA
jgi:hypothetical protein